MRKSIAARQKKMPYRPNADRRPWRMTSEPHSWTTHGFPATVYEYGSACGMVCRATMSDPVFRCHQRSGSEMVCDSIFANTDPRTAMPATDGGDSRRCHRDVATGDSLTE